MIYEIIGKTSLGMLIFQEKVKFKLRCKNKYKLASKWGQWGNKMFHVGQAACVKACRARKKCGEGQKDGMEDSEDHSGDKWQK